MFMTRAVLSRPGDRPGGFDRRSNRRSATLEWHHRMIWSLFHVDGAGRRDFLWREVSRNRFLILSARPPRHSRDFLLEARPYSLALQRGDRIDFRLRVNATCTSPEGRGRTDIVRREMLRFPTSGHVHDQRLAAARVAAPDWMVSQGVRSGFAVGEPAQDIMVKQYHVMRALRKSGQPAVFGVLDLEGTLQVTDPVQLCGAVAAGLGRARAFGCGLMLLGCGSAIAT